MQINQNTLNRLYRKGVRRLKRSDLLRVVRGSQRLGRLISGPLASMGEDAAVLLDMVKDYNAGLYRELPRATVLAAGFALLYALNPFDLMPDFIPGIGYVDDVSMLALVMSSIRHDVTHYRMWRKSRAAITRRLRITFGIRPRD